MSLTARPCFGYSNQVYKIRLVFAIDALNTTYPTNFVCFGNIRFYGDSAWAGGAMHTFPYDWDYQGNIIPNTDHVNSTQTLGVLGKQWKAVYSNYIYAKYAIYFRTGESSNSTYPRILSGDGSSMTVETSGGNAFIFNTAGNISYGLLRPSSTGTYSLGTSSYQWSNVYANGTVYLNGGTITANKTSLSISANGVTPVSLGTNITQDGVDTCTEGVLTFQRGWSDGTAGGLDKTTKLTPYQVDFGGISATWPTTAGTIMTTGLLGNTTTLTTPSTSATSGTAARDYYVGADSNGKLCVYVPWSTTQIANYQGYYLGAATATSVKAWTVVSGGSSGALVVASGTATATTSFLSAGTVSNASPTSTSTTTIACARPYIANAVVELVFFVPAGQTYYLNYYGSWTYLRYGVSRLGTT